MSFHWLLRVLTKCKYSLQYIHMSVNTWTAVDGYWLELEEGKFSPSSVERRSASSRYSSDAWPALFRHRSVLAKIMPAMAAPTAPSPRDHILIPNSSRLEVNTVTHKRKEINMIIKVTHSDMYSSVIVFKCQLAYP